MKGKTSEIESLKESLKKAEEEHAALSEENRELKAKKYRLLQQLNDSEKYARQLKEENEALRLKVREVCGGYRIQSVFCKVLVIVFLLNLTGIIL